MVILDNRHGFHGNLLDAIFLTVLLAVMVFATTFHLTYRASRIQHGTIFSALPSRKLMYKCLGGFLAVQLLVIIVTIFVKFMTGTLSDSAFPPIISGILY